MSKKHGIVNVTMVITEEKVLSNIDKIHKLINPNSKKKIVQLEEDTYFKDLVEAIKSYLIEYPNKKNFPINVYKATYSLIELATTQFEDTTKKIEGLIKQREENIVLSGVLKDAVNAVEEKSEDWQEKINEISDKFPEDIIDTLYIVANCDDKESKEYVDAVKLLNAKVNNLETNLHIEIDMERLEDASKALSYIGIEVADALKLIPTPEEQIVTIAEQNAAEEASKVNVVEEKVEKIKNIESVEEVQKIEKVEEVENAVEDKGIEELLETEKIEEAKEQYTKETTFEAKPTFWQKIKNSKLVRAASSLFRMRIKLEIPSNALPEGKGEK